jgi:ABC-type multidrug transport system fused ATPase/permease subunit
LIKKGVDSWRVWFMLGIGVFGLALGPVMWMQRAGVLKLQTRLALTLATRIVTKLFMVPLDFFTRRFGGEIGGRVMLADTVAGTVSGALVGMIASSMQVLVLGLAMMSYSVYLTTLALSLLLLHALLAGWIIRRTTNLSRLLALERGRYEAQLINAVSLVEHSRASGTTQAMMQKVLERYIAVANAEQVNAPYSALLGSLPGAMTGILMAVITGLSALEVIHGEFSIGVFVDPPDPGAVAAGLIPGFDGVTSVLLAASILGATVMPHAVYAHSALTRDRFGLVASGPRRREVLQATRWDVTIALVVAGAVNVAILVVGAGLQGAGGVDDIFTAYASIAVALGSTIAVFFGIALLASGLASTALGAFASAPARKTTSVIWAGWRWSYSMAIQSSVSPYVHVRLADIPSTPLDRISVTRSQSSRL